MKEKFLCNNYKNARAILNKITKIEINVDKSTNKAIMKLQKHTS